jgi:sensor domain DACNK-containing protein/DisA checkpoint controller-like protein
MTGSEADARRLRRLAEELEENGLPAGAGDPMFLEEVDWALRPAVHERRVASTGAILRPSHDAAEWERATGLSMSRMPIGERSVAASRRLADGLSSWLVRPSNELLLFDRPAGSERDLVVLTRALGATVVQRHPSGVVRVVGKFGLLRWDGLRWHREPPLKKWLKVVTGASFAGDADAIEALVEFAIHDLGAAGIGALLLYCPEVEAMSGVEQRLPVPPPLDVRSPTHLAPLRHVLSQVDGAAVFDAGGVLRSIGVRLVPTTRAETSVEPLRGTRHTSGRRYSFDHPGVTVIAVSEDGPVSLLRGGDVLGQSGAAPGR